MTRETAEAYAAKAIEELANCSTDAELSAWDDANTNSIEYIALPDDLVREMEKAFEARLDQVFGVEVKP